MTEQDRGSGTGRFMVRVMAGAWACVILLPLCGASASADEGAGQPSWPAAVQALRRDMLQAAPAEVTLGSWHYRGPEPAPRWNERWDEMTAPVVDLGARDTEGQPLWRQREDWPDGRVHGLPQDNDHVHYLARKVTAPSDTGLTVGLGSDDGFKLWLNGTLVAQNNVMRGASPNQEQIAITVPAGEHTLLLAVYQAGGGAGFYFQRADALPAMVALQRAYPEETAWFLEDIGMPPAAWLAREDNTLERKLLSGINQRLLPLNDALKREIEHYLRGNPPANDAGWLSGYVRARAVFNSDQMLLQQVESVDFEAARRAVKDLIETFGDRYPDGPRYLERIDAHLASARDMAAWRTRLRSDPQAAQEGIALVQLVRTALLANPLLDFDRLLLVHRRFSSDEDARRAVGPAAGFLGLNSYVHTSVRSPGAGWNDEIAVLSDLRGEPRLEPLYRPEGGRLVRDIDLEFGGDRFLFSRIGEHGRWAVFEIGTDGSGLRQVSPDGYPDVDFFEGAYLPDGRIVLSSTAALTCLDCENGGRPVSNMYLVEPGNDRVRQLTFDQVQPQHPRVMNDGRVLYMRWEYCDLPHYFSRILFTMNPDGTGQMGYYGSGSHFPTAFKHARPIPGHPRKVVGIIGGHHGLSESGRMAIIDPGLARAYPFVYRPETKEWGPPASYINIQTEVLPEEKTGFVHEFTKAGKDVVGNVLDNQVDEEWPHFIHPYPLSEKYYLVTRKRDRDAALWGIYLADVFDNFTLIKEIPGTALFEPTPLQARTRPPLIPDRVALESDTASVLVQDIYAGPGLAGIPRGTVDRLRIFAYHFAYNSTGGHESVGVESAWDVRRILGTVPIESDGSAHFVIPANTPISIQPIDKEGRTLQLMRSWMVGMPGERVSCVGCHEETSTAPPSHMAKAALAAPRPIDPWLGEPRPYSFTMEVQPVLDRYCIGCHDGEREHQGRKLHSFVDANPQIVNYRTATSYQNLHPYVRRPGPESDIRMHRPMEYHANTSPLIRMLEKGHYNVRLDEEAWERLYTWIDLNAPFRGRWAPPAWRGHNQAERRVELAREFGGSQVNPEAEAEALLRRYRAQPRPAFVAPEPWSPPAADGLQAEGFPFGPERAREMQQGTGDTERVIELGQGPDIRLRRIPAGRFIMGAQDGYPDEQPRAVVPVEQPFWMGETEVTNAQYALFDPGHDTGYHDEHGKDNATPGYIGNHRDQPVTRITWQEAMAYCAWLSEKTGMKVTLPTEAQWEWAARAGSGTRFFIGDVDSDFSAHANLSDHTQLFTRKGWDGGSRIQRGHPYDRNHHFPLREDRFNDGSLVANYVGRYQPNPWGLHDIVGNVNEWTRTAYRPYPYRGDDGRNAGNPRERKVARGGSWHDRPRDAGAAVRFAYESHQKVFNVGFRVIVED